MSVVKAYGSEWQHCNQSKPSCWG